MALDDGQPQYVPKNNNFYRDHYHHVIIGIMIILVITMIISAMVMYQMNTRPLPIFSASQPNGKSMQLTAYDTPNLQPATILRWASKAATVSYTFDFANYKQQIALARPYFTEAGWQDFLSSVTAVLDTIVSRQIGANGVVSGTPVISNQGPLPGKGYTWRVQIPFLVSYQTSSYEVPRNFIVVLTIVRVPTSVNPQGIGVDQFVMYTA